MSLIKCPECNKDVSNHANTCPNCGFEIKKYINKIKEEEQIKIHKEKLRIEYEKRIQKEEDELKIQAKFETMPKHKPIITKGILLGISLILFGIVSFFVYKLCFGVGFFTIILPLFLVVAGCLCINDGIKDLNVIRALYTKYKNNEDKYKIEVLKYYKKTKSDQLTFKDLKEISDKNKQIVHCPYCNSTNVKKITTTSRVISTAAVGVASKKIGKQWHCNKCKSDF